MKNQVNVSKTNKQKQITINILFATSIIIMLLGVVFSVFSAVNDISFQVLTSTIHGSIFGLLAVYLGVRYFLSVKKLKMEVYKNTSSFSWKNFKKETPNNVLAKSR